MAAAPTSPELDEDTLARLDAWWRAANYLTVGQIYLQANPLLREPLAAEHIKPRLLGHWGTSPGLSMLYAHLSRLIAPRRPGHDLRHRSRPRRPGPGGQHLPRGHLHRRLSRRQPRPDRDAAAVPPVLDPGRHPQPRQRAHPRLDPRGRRAGLRPGPRLRRRLRQPRPDRGLRGGRRRGRDRSAGGLLEGHPLPQPGSRRRRAAHPAPQRLQDQRSHRAGPGRPRPGGPTAGRPRLPGPDRGRSRTGRRAPPAGRRPRRRAGQHRPHPGRRPDPVAARCCRAAGRPSCSTRPRAGPGPRRSTGWPVEGTFRAHQVPLANVRDEPAHLRLLEEWMRSYRPDELFDANGRPASRAGRAGPRGRPADGRQPPGQRRPPAPCPGAARLARLRGRGRPRRGRTHHRVDGPAGPDAARHLPAQRRAWHLPAVLPGRDQLATGWARCSRSPTAAWSSPPPRPTTTCRPTAGSWRC